MANKILLSRSLFVLWKRRILCAIPGTLGQFRGIFQGNAGTVVYHGNGDGTFQTGLVVSNSQSSVAIGDFNGDGKPDLVIANDSGSAQLLSGNGDGTFQAPVTVSSIPAGNLPVLQTGDFNNDGKLDLAFFVSPTPGTFRAGRAPR